MVQEPDCSFPNCVRVHLESRQIKNSKRLLIRNSGCSCYRLWNSGWREKSLTPNRNRESAYSPRLFRVMRSALGPPWREMLFEIEQSSFQNCRLAKDMGRELVDARSLCAKEVFVTEAETFFRSRWGMTRRTGFVDKLFRNAEVVPNLLIQRI